MLGGTLSELPVHFVSLDSLYCASKDCRTSGLVQGSARQTIGAPPAAIATLSNVTVPVDFQWAHFVIVAEMFEFLVSSE